MLTPAYKLTLGRKLIDTTDEPKASTVVDLTVALDMDTPADEFRLVLGNVGRFRPAREDEAKIELGYADNGGLTQVMTGAVVRVEPNLKTIRVAGYSAAGQLLRTFVEQTYESKTAGVIVRDLADKAGVDVATAEDGINFPAYVIDGRRSVYHHMRDLAELCGFDLYINADGQAGLREIQRRQDRARVRVRQAYHRVGGGEVEPACRASGGLRREPRRTERR